jgi:glycosyltransferase involved in cell wall biosynthesis
MNSDGIPHILHVHSSFDPGGKEMRCVALISAFGNRARHSIVSAIPEAMGAAELIPPEIMADYPAFPPLTGLPTPGRLKRIADAMRGYDLILTYNWGAMDAVMGHTLYADVMRLPPLVHHEDGFNEDEATRLKWRRNFYRKFALGRAAALVVPSRRLEDIALNIWQQPRARVHRIANGIDVAAYAVKPPRDTLSGLLKHEGEYWVGTMAGLRKVKNLPLLVRCAAKLPDEWQLVIFGKGPEREAILAEAAACGIEHRVHLPGFAEKPAEVIGLFDIFALSSKSEQFPISVVEAMAAGLPVAAPDVGDVKAMLAEENRAYVAPAEDGDALARKLEELSRDGELRAKLGAANRACAMAQYEESRMVDRYRSLYSGLIRGTRL